MSGVKCSSEYGCPVFSVHKFIGVRCLVLIDVWVSGI